MAFQGPDGVTVEHKTFEMPRLTSRWKVVWQNGSWAILDDVGLLYDNYDTLSEVLAELSRLGNRLMIVAEA
jgi:hypothetical protein